jgi:hypothetical protein
MRYAWIGVAMQTGGDFAMIIALRPHPSILRAARFEEWDQVVSSCGLLPISY